MAAASIADVKNAMKSYSYDTVTGKDDRVCTRALEAAELWTSGKMAKAGYTDVDTTTDYLRQVVVAYAVYHLHAYNDQEGVAEDKLKMARELLEAAIGLSATSNGSNSPAARPVAVVTNPEVSSWLTAF
jgi:hypothetical protein